MPEKQRPKELVAELYGYMQDHHIPTATLAAGDLWDVLTELERLELLAVTILNDAHMARKYQIMNHHEGGFTDQATYEAERKALDEWREKTLREIANG